MTAMPGASAPVIDYLITVPQRLGIVVRFRDAEGAPIDLSGAAWDVDVRPTPSSDPVASFDVDATDADNGQIVLRMEPDQSLSIRNGMRSTLYRTDIDQPVLTIRWLVDISMSDGS